MTPRQRLAAALRRQPVDRIPWTIDIAYYNHAMREQGRLPSEYEGIDGFLKQHEDLGVDPYYYYPTFWAYEDVYEGTEHDVRESRAETVHTFSIDGKSLTFVLRYMPESFCWAHFKYPVETVGDMELLLKVLRGRRMVPAIDRHRDMQARWGERGLLALGAPRTPLPELISEWCGLTAISMIAFDAPDLLAEVISQMDRMMDPIFEAIAEYKPVVVHFPDNISGENVGSFWAEYMAPIYRKRLEQMHKAGIVCAIHNDGTIHGILGRIAEVGFDAAEAITPSPVGDLAVGELRSEVGRDDFVLWGMVPGAAFAPGWSENEFRIYMENALRSVEGPFILGSADQIPPDGDVSRVAIVTQMLSQTPVASRGRSFAGPAASSDDARQQ